MLIVGSRTDGLPPSVEIEIISRLYDALIQVLCIAACLIVGAHIAGITGPG